MGFYLNELLSPVREIFEESQLKEMTQKAYPQNGILKTKYLVEIHAIRTLPEAPKLEQENTLPIDEKMKLITQNVHVKQR